MTKHSFPILLGGMLLSACVPGSALDRPPVEGIITDAATHRPLAGARITLVKLERIMPKARIPWRKLAADQRAQPEWVEEDATVKSLPSTLSDSQGHFTLPARYTLGVVLLYGDPVAAPVLVRVNRENYRTLDIQESYNFYLRPFDPIHLRPFDPIRVHAALELNSTPARAKTSSPSYIIP